MKVHPRAVHQTFRWGRKLLIVTILLASRTGAAWDFKLWDQELSLDLTNTFNYTYHMENGDRDLLRPPPDNKQTGDDMFHQFFNTLDVSLRMLDFRLGARFDLHLFADTPFEQSCEGEGGPSWCNQRDTRYTNHFRPERVFFTVARPEFDMTLGDFYASFGKGMALHIVKIDDLGQDTAIRGGKFVFHRGDLDLTFVGGEFNPLSMDKSTGRQALWRSEPLVGGRVEYRFFDLVSLGIHSVYIITDDPNVRSSKERTDHNMVWGAGLDIPSIWDDRLSMGVEVDLQQTVSYGEAIRGPDAEGGLAVYATSTLLLGDLTVMGEFKHYDDFLLQAPGAVNEPYRLIYHQPPTLELYTAEIKDNTKVTGGRLRMDYNIGAAGPLELLVFVNFGYFYNWFDDDHRIYDPYGGLEIQWMEGEGQLSLTAGSRFEHDQTTDEPYRRDIHVELSVEQMVAASHSLRLNARLLARQYQRPFDFHEWKELDLSLGYKWSPYLSLAVTYERQEDPLIVFQREAADLALGAENYLGGSVQYYINSGTYVNLRVGQNRPGIKCINGMCRAYPSFSGAELNMIGRF